MNVYDFKAPGVAMAMYNTDDVSVHTCDGLHLTDDGVWRVVDYWICARKFQDGYSEEDASVYEHQEHDHEEVSSTFALAFSFDCVVTLI